MKQKRNQNILKMNNHRHNTRSKNGCGMKKKKAQVIKRKIKGNIKKAYSQNVWIQ